MSRTDRRTSPVMEERRDPPPPSDVGFLPRVSGRRTGSRQDPKDLERVLKDITACQSEYMQEAGGTFVYVLQGVELKSLNQENSAPAKAKNAQLRTAPDQASQHCLYKNRNKTVQVQIWSNILLALIRIRAKLAKNDAKIFLIFFLKTFKSTIL